MLCLKDFLNKKFFVIIDDVCYLLTLPLFFRYLLTRYNSTCVN